MRPRRRPLAAPGRLAALSSAWRGAWWLPWLGFALLLAAAPWLARGSAALGMLAQMGIAIIACLSYNILLGQGGMLSFGHAVYTGLGAYAAIHLLAAAGRHGWPLPVSLLPLAGGLAALAAAALLGWLGTRRGGATFAMISLGLGELIFAAARMLTGLSGGDAGIAADRVLGPPLLGLSFGPVGQVYALVAAYTFACTALMYALTRTPLGRLLNAVRDKAFADFKAQGFPSRKVERYKYTDMAQLFKPDYGLNLNRLEIPVNPYQAFKCDVPNLSTSLYFVVNDSFYTKSLPQTHIPDGVVVDSLRRVAAEKPDFIEKYYAKIAQTGTDAITALNTMLAQDGLLVYVPRNVKVDRTVQVINILRSDVDLMVNRRVLIVLEEGAEAKFLFCDHASDDRRFLATQVIEAYVGRNASLELNCLEETHYKNTRISNVYIEQQADSRVNHNVITLHNGVTRNRLDLVFKGEGAECQCNGCVIADRNQHVDNNTLIDHQVPHCTSNELYKYVLDEEATGAFAGRVLVRKDAQKTISQETNQNLVATKKARMYTQPMLEIYADDVKCAHGSTVGQLNDAAMFYMRQRGISEREAKLLLEFAFVNEVIDKMELEPLRDRLHYLVEKRFRGELNKCDGCKLCK